MHLFKKYFSAKHALLFEKQKIGLYRYDEDVSGIPIIWLGFYHNIIYCEHLWRTNTYFILQMKVSGKQHSRNFTEEN